jgi:TetR/AcrR family transcriptional regulator
MMERTMSSVGPRKHGRNRQGVGEVATVNLESRRERTARAKRAQILDAALEVFSRSGLQGARLDEIADKANISKANLFYYFTTKESIYLAVLVRTLDEWIRPLKDFTVQGEPLDQVIRYITEKLEHSRTAPAASRLLCMEMLAGAPLLGDMLSGPLKKLTEEKTAVIREWARSGRIVNIDPYHLLFMIWATTQHYADFSTQIKIFTGRTLDDPRFAKKARESVLELFLNGLRPRKEDKEDDKEVRGRRAAKRRS